MKAFIERLKNAYKYEWAYDDEPLPIQIIVGVFTCIYMILLFVYIVVLAVTCPLWVIPYAIYWIKKEKK